MAAIECEGRREKPSPAQAPQRHRGCTRCADYRRSANASASSDSARRIRSACWREPITTTAATYSAGCQKNEQTAIAAAIATHSSAVAPIAFAGSRTDNSLIVAGGRRSGDDPACIVRVLYDRI